jgi:hypothetical protein
MGDVLFTLWCRTHLKIKEVRRRSPGDSRALKTVSMRGYVLRPPLVGN